MTPELHRPLTTHPIILPTKDVQSTILQLQTLLDRLARIYPGIENPQPTPRHRATAPRAMSPSDKQPSLPTNE